MAMPMLDTFDGPNLPARRRGNLVNAAVIVANRDRQVSLDAKLQQIIAARSDRAKYFPEDMFADPAWDILLELALAEQLQHRVSVTSLCVGSRVPQTTALRWIKHMTDLGWLVRRNDPFDARRSFIELSKDTSERMRAYLLSVDPAAAV